MGDARSRSDNVTSQPHHLRVHSDHQNMVPTYRFLRASPFILGMAVHASIALGQAQRIDISEPAIVSLERLFKEADLVAVVSILSGDGEHYRPITVYKAEVVAAFKGTRKGERIYLGPFATYAVGGEYVAFLRRSREAARPTEKVADPALNYGTIDALFNVMYDGYSMMPAQYICVFDGKETREQCSDGVKVNTYQVKLPKGVKTYPLEPDDAPANDKKWVKRTTLEFVLGTLQGAR